MARAFIIIALMSLIVASCDEEGSEESIREADVYAAMIRELAPDPAGDPTPPTDELEHAVFAGPLVATGTIPIEVQVAVVDDLEDLADIRFVDHRTEALSKDEDEKVLERGVLVLLGPVPEGPSPTVAAVRYVDRDDFERVFVDLRGSGEEWRVEDIRPVAR